MPFPLACLCVVIVLLSLWELEGKGGMQELMEIGWHKHCYLAVLGSPQVVTKPMYLEEKRQQGSKLLLCSLQMLLGACSKG